YSLDLNDQVLGSASTVGTLAFEAMGDGVTFLTPPVEHETEITGPCAVRLFVSSSTADADLFVVLRVFTPDLHEITFQGAIDPHTPIGQGWLRASHRTLDTALSLPYRPYHTHTDPQPLTPGEIVRLDVEIWPTSIVVPPGHRIGLSVRGRDYEAATDGGKLSNFKNVLRGCGPFLHDDPNDRPPALFAGRTTLHAAAGQQPVLLLPIIPSRTALEAS
ncbi:MAG: CocE/NonD family hydrolase C-terminal non-catalytic domain-containing protein, partial [Janthinobacterium lividum]